MTDLTKYSVDELSVLDWGFPGTAMEAFDEMKRRLAAAQEKNVAQQARIEELVDALRVWGGYISIDLEGDDLSALADLERQLAEKQAILDEQESVVLSIGPITCRNGHKHDRVDECIYCLLAEAKAEIERMRPVVEAALLEITFTSKTKRLVDVVTEYEQSTKPDAGGTET